MKHNNPWPLEQVARLRELVAQGKTRREISAAMGLNRNVVIGKIHRLKLKLPPFVYQKPEKPIGAVSPGRRVRVPLW